MEEDLPDDEVKYCPDCGFALPPLTTQCPRCARFGHAPVTREEPPAEFPPVASPGAYPAAASARPRSRVGLLIVAIIMVAIAVAIPFVILNSPGYKARVAYREAVQAQLAGDMETAKAKYRQALDYDPEMGLAAFGLGTACLGISIGGRTDQRMSQLLQSAAVGVTTDLDEADRWFDHSIVLANKMPTNQALQDPNISTPPKLASYAHAMKGLTALIRYYAALQADDFDIANQWLQAASAEIHQSLAFDPTNPYAHDFSGQLTP